MSDSPPRTPSAMYLMAGGDPVTLEDAQKRVFKEFDTWLRGLRVDLGEANISTIVQRVARLVVSEVATAGILGMQDVVNRNAKLADHEEITAEARYAICSKCAQRIAPDSLRRETMPHFPSIDDDQPTRRIRRP